MSARGGQSHRSKLNPDGTCTRCGLLHPKCAAHKRDGSPCGQIPMHHQDVCYRHGGASAQAKRKAAVAGAEAEADRWLADLAIKPVSNPLAEMGLMIGKAKAFMEFIEQRLGGLDADDWRYKTDGGEQLRAEVALFERALDRVQKFLVDSARLNIDERLAQITEAQAARISELVERLVVGLLSDPELGLTREQVERGCTIVAPRHLDHLAG